MPSLIAPYTLPSENTTESQISKNFSQVYILMGKAPYSRNTEKQLFLKIKVYHVKGFKGFTIKIKVLKVFGKQPATGNSTEETNMISHLVLLRVTTVVLLGVPLAINMLRNKLELRIKLID